ncbi:MAG: AAA family ATPase [Bacteroidia bacterium]
MGKPIFKYNPDLWTEKYRPKTLKDYVGTSELKEKFEKFIKEKNIPHLLFAGPAGVGKSSVANLLVSALECDVLYINAAEERGIDTVREKILRFCTTSSFYPLKIVVLDEFSEATNDAQNSLKAVLEQYSQHTRFIFTANHVENIVEAIRSRCQEFDVVSPSRPQIEERCKFILATEKIDYEAEDLVEIVRHNYPDVRKTIQYLDQQSVGRELKLDKEFYKLIKYEKQVVELLKQTTDKNIYDKATEIRQLIANTRVRNFISLYKYLFQEVDNFAKINKRIKVIFDIQDGLKSDGQIADREMNMIATILRIMESLI